MRIASKTSWWCLVDLLLFFLPSVQPQMLSIEEATTLDSILPLENEQLLDNSSATLPTAENNEEKDDGNSPIFCPQNTLTLAYGEFNLPQTEATVQGVRVVSSCPFGVKSVGSVRIFPIATDEGAVKKQESSSSQEPGLTSYCILDENSTVGIWNHVQDDNVFNCREQGWVDVGNEVRTLTMEPVQITPNNVRQAVPLLGYLSRNAFKDYESAQILIESVSRLLEEDAIFNDPSLQGVGGTIGLRKTLFNLIESYVRYAQIQVGEKVSLSSNCISVETVIFPNNNNNDSLGLSDHQYNYNFQSMHLPAEAVAMSRTTMDHQPRLQLISYSNELFFHWGQERTWTDPNSTEAIPDDPPKFPGNWRVISMTIEGASIKNLKQPVVYTLPVNHTVSNGRWVCVFWDTVENKWSDEGMKSIQLPNGTLQCESDHLTAFSALLDPLPTPDDSDGSSNGDGNSIVKPKGPIEDLEEDIHAHILSILSSVGSALSITGLAITVLTFALFRCLRRERSNRILLNLSLSLFFLHLMSLISDTKLWNNACLIPATLMHYLLLTSVSWMLVEALHMYSLLISVFVQPQSRFLTKRSLFAWGAPLIIVIICAAVDPKVYRTGRGDWCIMAGYLNLPMYYAGYLGPAALMLLVNCFVFIRILQVLSQQGANARKQSKMVSPEIKLSHSETNKNHWKSIKPASSFFTISPTQVKGALTVMMLLGVGWILGFFAIGPFKLVFTYLFCLCNAGQGVLIFLFRVLLHPQACRTWRKAVTKGFSFDSDLTISSVSSSSRKTNSSPSFSSTPSTLSASSSAANTLTRSDPTSSKLAATLNSFLEASP